MSSTGRQSCGASCIPLEQPCLNSRHNSWGSLFKAMTQKDFREGRQSIFNGERGRKLSNTDKSTIHFSGAIGKMNYAERDREQPLVISKTRSDACLKELRLYKYLSFFFQKDKKNSFRIHEFQIAKQTLGYGQRPIILMRIW